MLMMEKFYGLTPFLPTKELKENLETFIENVTMDVWTETMNSTCNIKVRKK